MKVTSAATRRSQTEETSAAELQSQINEQEIRIAELEVGARETVAAYGVVVARLAEIELRLVNGF